MLALRHLQLCFALSLFVLNRYAGAACVSSYNDLKFCDNCPGRCDDENGCYCDDTYESCLPHGNASCSILDLTMCCPDKLYYNQSGNCCSDEPICSNPCAPNEVCSPSGTCVCNPKLYQNKTRSDIQPSLNCTNDVIIVRVSTCLLETLGYEPSLIHLQNSSLECTTAYPVTINNETVTEVQLQTTAGYCGNTIKEDESYIYIGNVLNIPIKNKTLITINKISMNFTCAYKKSMNSSLLLANVTSQTVKLPGINETGEYPVTMTAYKESTFTDEIQENDEVVIGSDIYVGLLVQNINGSAYGLQIQNCSASPTLSLDDKNAFSLINGSCNTTNDVSTTVLENGNSTQARFRISSFKFQDYASVYLICNVRLCNKDSASPYACSKCGQSRSIDDFTRQLGLNVNFLENLFSSSGKLTATTLVLLAGVQFALMFMKLF